MELGTKDMSLQYFQQKFFRGTYDNYTEAANSIPNHLASMVAVEIAAYVEQAGNGTVSLECLQALSALQHRVGKISDDLKFNHVPAASIQH